MLLDDLFDQEQADRVMGSVQAAGFEEKVIGIIQREGILALLQEQLMKNPEPILAGVAEQFLKKGPAYQAALQNVADQEREKQNGGK